MKHRLILWYGAYRIKYSKTILNILVKTSNFLSLRDYDSLVKIIDNYFYGQIEINKKVSNELEFLAKEIKNEKN